MLAAAFTFFLLSLIGIPMTGGFFAKFYVFSAALRTHLVWLTILGVLNSGMGSYYYLRLIVRMYMHEPQSESPRRADPLGCGAGPCAQPGGDPVAGHPAQHRAALHAGRADVPVGEVNRHKVTEVSEVSKVSEVKSKALLDAGPFTMRKYSLCCAQVAPLLLPLTSRNV